MGLVQAIIAGPPQAPAAHPLREGAFNARAGGIALPKGWCLLLLATSEQGLLGRLRTHVQHATGGLRAGTLGSARTRLTGRARKDDLHAFWIAQGRPATTP